MVRGRRSRVDGGWRTIIGALPLLVGATCASTACNVGPDHVRPRVSLNASWGGDRQRATSSAVNRAWWREFRDPTLDGLIELAYRQNLTLRIAGLRILEARAQLGVARGEQLPRNVGSIASGFAVGRSEHGVADQEAFERHFGQYDVGFDAIWELDLWGKYRRAVRAAHANYLAAVADYDDAITSLTAEVARTYVLIRTFEVLIELARQNVRLQAEGLEIAESRFRNGATSELDVAQATNLLESTRATIPALEVGLQQAQNALSTLLAQPTGHVRALLGNPGDIPTTPGRVGIGVPAELLRRRPDIRAAELRAISQVHRIGVAKAELYPSFVLSGSIGFETTSGLNNSKVSDLFRPGSLVYRAGGSVFWPILQYPRIVNSVRVEDARYQQLLVEYVNTVLVAAQEVEDGIAGFLLTQEAAVSAQKAVDSADLAVKLALVQYREGAVDYQRVLDTQRVLLDSQNRLTATRSSVATNMIALYKALGGGWELRQDDPILPDSTRRQMKDRTNWDGYFSEPRKRQETVR